MVTMAIALLIGQLLIILVGVTFYIINHQRCKHGKRPIGYGPRATCNDIRNTDDPFYRHLKGRR